LGSVGRVSFDVSSFVALPRLTGLALSLDGSRLVTSVQEPDGARYASSLWQIPLDGRGEPIRLTRSEKGESLPAFRPDGSLLFVSSRPANDVGEDESAIWTLPASGEPSVLAAAPGGLSGAVVAAESATVVVGGSWLVGSTSPEDDAERRKQRKDGKVTAIEHTGFPIRYWDHELGVESPRLFILEDGGLRDLAPDAGFALTNADYSISADGTRLATTWRTRHSRGRFPYGLVVIDVASGERRVVAASADVDYELPRIAPSGDRVAVVRTVDGDFDTPFEVALEIHGLEFDSVVSVALGDVHPTELAWARDSQTLFVVGDWHGRSAVLAVDAESGATRCLANDAAYLALCPSPDGRYVYALRTTVAAPPAPVRLDAALEQQPPAFLPTPAPISELPGTMVEVSTEVAGGDVCGWLCLPDGVDGEQAPLLVFVHGGPFLSTNAWSWRWNPWVAVAQGWAVLLPDPALSTGYGPDWIARAWPHCAAPVWRDIEALLDHVLSTQPLDATRTACLGGSFGGYMTNWIAGHTDRFGAIVTHAGLWALDQQHTTTDAAQWKSNLFGTPADHPEWYAENSPHHAIDNIVTPMLVVHGNRDYRVPVSEALRLWWDLVSHWRGDPDELPHRFLQFTGENHWILSPANAAVWYSTVLGFCATHVLKQTLAP